MENPWLKLPDEPPFVLDPDRDCVDRYNASRQSERTKINLNSIPEPFIGDPTAAKLVLLNLNPGDSEGDQAAHKSPNFKAAMIRNLRHDRQEFAFYPLNPAFRETPCAVWWRRRTAELRRASGLDDATFAARLFVIEWFPYHTKKAGLPATPKCDSQKYSFYLAKQTLANGNMVVRMRAETHWVGVDSRFKEIPHLKNPQCGYVSKGNSEGNLFQRMVEALREP